MRKTGQSGRFWWAVAVVAAAALALAGAPALATTSQPGSDAAGAYSPLPTYQAHDYARGQAMDILPAGENGLVNLPPAQALRAHREAPGQQPGRARARTPAWCSGPRR